MSRSVGELNIGPLRYDLRPGLKGPVRYAAPAYAGFCAPPVYLPLAELPVDIRSECLALPGDKPLFQAGGHWGVWETGGEWLFAVGLQAPPSLRRACRVPRGLSGAELTIDPAAGPDAVRESPLRYPLDQILSWGLLSKIGGVLLHAAAAVQADGTGWVLAGRSGAGKSTLAGLCHAQGWRILNDDRVMVFRRDGGWRVAGTPWHGSGRFAEAAEVPLGGVALLAQAPENRFESLTASQARLALLDVAAVPWFAEEWSQGVLDGLDRLVREIPPVRLHFTRTAEAVRMLAGEAVMA
ncbi:MAG TPA: hypothetical protein PLJ99_00025 [Kiritimatiellia bacterium]|nr:hypothetical protein [Kiritimatiellia bacterium]